MKDIDASQAETEEAETTPCNDELMGTVDYGKLDDVSPSLVTLCVGECNETLDKVKAYDGKMQWSLCPPYQYGGKGN
ncbi:hypothetical protein TOPH_08619 [Tolypocladium ophioglossoides CBS 100239]|uniref:Uncharacterized protein n=1 Tax=Tolypocladium ophioglossoides (strain CBS 100239) TaxID=1163406 RepID=A0A0L0MYB5_TOLOC|nr:hypothetical protein TOPH_08619 [Tolypocladium ophioglossoides CBS 100239]